MSTLYKIWKITFDLLFVFFISAYQNPDIQKIILYILVPVSMLGFSIKIKKEYLILFFAIFILNFFYLQVTIDSLQTQRLIFNLIALFCLIGASSKISRFSDNGAVILILFCIMYIENWLTGELSGFQNNFGLIVTAALVGYYLTNKNINILVLYTTSLISFISFKRVAIIISASIIIDSIFHLKITRSLRNLFIFYTVIVMFAFLILRYFPDIDKAYLQRLIENRIHIDSFLEGSDRIGIVNIYLTELFSKDLFSIIFFPNIRHEYFFHSHNQFVEYIATIGAWSIIPQLFLYFILIKIFLKQSNSIVKFYIGLIYLFITFNVSVPSIELHYLMPLLYFFILSSRNHA